MLDKIKQVKEIYSKIRLYTGQPTEELSVVSDDQINAWTNGKVITVTTGLLKFLDGDKDEIALILGHESSHVMIGHITDGSHRFTTAQMESQADKMGAYLMMKAGYDICKGREFFKKLKHMGSGDFADPGIYESPHPSYGYRYDAVSMPWCE